MKEGQPAGYDEKGNIRFEHGSQKCQKCGTKDGIIQYDTDTKMKGLPVTQIRFICRNCALKLGIPIK